MTSMRNRRYSIHLQYGFGLIVGVISAHYALVMGERLIIGYTTVDTGFEIRPFLSQIEYSEGVSGSIGDSRYEKWYVHANPILDRQLLSIADYSGRDEGYVVHDVLYGPRDTPRFRYTAFVTVNESGLHYIYEWHLELRSKLDDSRYWVYKDLTGNNIFDLILEFGEGNARSAILYYDQSYLPAKLSEDGYAIKVDETEYLAVEFREGRWQTH